MTIEIRDLVANDLEALKKVSQSVWEDDYAPNDFQSWLDDDSWQPVGVFENGQLVSFAVLHEIVGASFGWVKALRTEATHHRHGYGLKLVAKLIEIAKERDLSELKYVTSSRNEASLHLAEKLGFEIAEQIPSFRFERPYPPHPKPSPSFIPLPVSAERVYETVVQYPDLVTNDYIPIPFDFEKKSLEGFKRMEKVVQFFLIIDENGEPLTLYYYRDFERKDAFRRRVTIFSRERSTFVDTIARIIEQTEKTDIDNLGFFLGSNDAEWVSSMLLVPGNMQDRFLILLSKNLR